MTDPQSQARQVLQRNGVFVCTCGNHQRTNQTLPWCARCGCEYQISGETVTIKLNTAGHHGYVRFGGL